MSHPSRNLDPHTVYPARDPESPEFAAGSVVFDAIPEPIRRAVADAVASQSLEKMVFSSPRRDSTVFRTDARPVRIRGQWKIQLSSRTKTQVFHANVEASDAVTKLLRLTAEDFRNITLQTASEELDIHVSRKGRFGFHIRRRSPHSSAESSESGLHAAAGKISASDDTESDRDVGELSLQHNRSRKYLIPDGVPCPFLIRVGMMSEKGEVRAGYRRKFAQINRYLEFIDDVAELLPSDRPINIVDFGCGKSYLTFAVHYFLTVVRNRECRIYGLDRRADVVQTCRRIVDELHLQNIEFSTGEIVDFKVEIPVDMVISLHACDTATDESLAQAALWNARVIFAVPCCQKELNACLDPNALPPLTSQGLSRDRLAALATDSMRAALMNAAGYRTQLLEFIEMEHTHRNVLLRCTRVAGETDLKRAEKSVSEVRSLRSLLRVPALTLERLLIRHQFLNDADSQGSDSILRSGSSLSS